MEHRGVDPGPEAKCCGASFKNGKQELRLAFLKPNRLSLRSSNGMANSLSNLNTHINKTACAHTHTHRLSNLILSCS